MIVVTRQPLRMFPLNPIIHAKEDTFLFELSSWVGEFDLWIHIVVLSSERKTNPIRNFPHRMIIKYLVLWFYVSFGYWLSLICRVFEPVHTFYIHSTVCIYLQLYWICVPTILYRISNSSDRLQIYYVQITLMKDYVEIHAACIYMDTQNILTTAHYIQMGYRSSYHSNSAAIASRNHSRNIFSLRLLCVPCVLMLAHNQWN